MIEENRNLEKKSENKFLWLINSVISLSLIGTGIAVGGVGLVLTGVGTILVAKVILSEQRKDYLEDIFSYQTIGSYPVTHNLPSNNPSATTININGPLQGAAVVNGDLHYHPSESKKSLVDAAQEIQELLENLSQTYSQESEFPKEILAAEAIAQVEHNPPLKQRILDAVKSANLESLENLVDHPAASIFIAAVKGWAND